MISRKFNFYSNNEINAKSSLLKSKVQDEYGIGLRFYIKICIILSICLCLISSSCMKRTIVNDETIIQKNEINVAKDIDDILYTNINDKIRNLYNEKLIGISSVKNAREVGGYITNDGKKVKTGLLIRSGNLHSITDKDVEILNEKYKNLEVIDFRVDFEIEDAPDRVIEGIRNIRIPVSDMNSDKELVMKNYKNVVNDTSVDPLITYYYVKGTLKDMNDELLNSKYSNEKYYEFFKEVLSHDGPILFHCSSGKDRTGFASALILSILGVDRETILDDYEASNVFYEEKCVMVERVLRKNNIDEKEIKDLIALVGVDRSVMGYVLDTIDNKYGGINNYMKNQIKLTDLDIEKLKVKYLVQQ